MFQIRIPGRTKKEETILPVENGHVQVLVAGVHERITVRMSCTIDNRLVAFANVTSNGIPISETISIEGKVGKKRDPFIPRKPDARSRYRRKNA